MLEDMKINEGRVMKRVIEEQNEGGFGYRMTIYVEPEEPLNKYVSVDAKWIAEGEDTDEGFGFILSPRAAYEIARALERSADDVMRWNEAPF